MNSHKQNNSIDFIKGVATLSVIFLHNSPNYYIGSSLWIGQAVPLFLLVTSYLTYQSFENGKNHKSYYSLTSTFKMLNRVFVPFFAVTVVQLIIIYVINKKIPFFEILLSGGFGPGSYYPWIFLQVWLVLPLIIYITNKISVKKSFIFFLLLSISCEIISSVIAIDPSFYRLIFYKYLFLIYLGCLVKKLNLTVTIPLCILALISSFFILLLTYTDLNFEPLIFNSGWKIYNWLTYFYPVLLFLILTSVYSKNKNSNFLSFFVLLGKYSYEIFLCQMFLFSFINLQRFSFIKNIYFQNFAYILFTTIFSLAPIFIYKLYINKTSRLKNNLTQNNIIS